MLWILVALLSTISGCEALFGGTDDTVSPNLGVGEACEDREECRSGLTCLEGLCQPAGDRQLNSTCILTGECAEGLYCSSQGFCQAAGTSQEGQGCVTSGDCVHGLYCEYHGLAGICQTGGTGDLGAACTSSAQCLAGLGCGPSGTCIQGLPAGGLVPYSGGTCPETGVQAEDPFKVFFHVPRTGETVTDFYGLPFPNDIRLRTGHVDLSGHPHPTLETVGNVVLTLIDLIEQDVTGFSINQAVFFRFNTFPDAASLTLTGEQPTLSLVNIDSDSERYGQRKSLIWAATDARGLYICENWMGVRPFWDDPFDPDTTYAAIITDQIRGSGNRLPAQDEDFVAMVSDVSPTDPDLREAWETYSPLRAYLVDQELEPETVMAAAVFTTGRPTYHQPGIAEAVKNAGPIATGDWVLCDGETVSPCDDGLEGDLHVRGCFSESEDYYEIHTLVEVPIYQEGTPPYLDEGGSFILDESGVPIEQSTQEVCTVITIPKDQAMPEGGWPVVVFAHGTGGNFRSHLATVASDLSGIGYATIGYDGVQHGSRRGASEISPEALFFNYGNPRAAAGNVLQGAADVHLFGRLAAEVQLSAQQSPTGGQIRFNPDQIVFFGHSQGGTVGVLALAQDENYDAAILSGTGGGLILSLPEKKAPIDIASGLKLLLPNESLNDFHPVMNLIQLYFDPVDPLNFGRRLMVERPADLDGIHIFQTYGVSDTYTPPRSIRELAMAIGLPAMTPVIADYPRPTVDPPVTENVLVGEDRFTCVLGQYNPPASSDGHFVIFENETASSQMLGFLESFIEDGVPTVPAP